MKILLSMVLVAVVGMGAWASGAEVEKPSPGFEPNFSAFIGCSPMTIACGSENFPGKSGIPGAGGRTVSVSGTAVTRTMPDLIVWRITTSDFSKDLLLAKESSDRKLRAILGLKDELGIKPEDLETGHVSIRREYERDERGHQTEFKHYVVSRSVTIRQRDLKRFDEFFSKLVSSAEMEVSLSFESSRIHELRAETRLKALRIAEEKARAMVGELGAKLGKVLSIDEHRPSGQPFGLASNVAFFDPGGRAEVDVSSGTFAPGAIEVRVTVYATFGIE